MNKIKLVSMYTTSTLVYLIDQSQFWSNFVSGILVAILISFLLPWYLNYIKRPKQLLMFFESINFSDQKDMNDSNKIEYNFLPIIYHKGGNPFLNGVYWHIYVPIKFNSAVNGIGLDTAPGKEHVNDSYFHYYGHIKESIFGDSTRNIQYKFYGELDDKELMVLPVLYFFSTDYGLYPRGVKYLKNMPGIIDSHTMGKLYLTEKNIKIFLDKNN